MYKHFFKRIFDFFGSLILIVLLSPILLIVVILELIFHGWPPVYVQKRVGKGRKVFRVYKFRSMTNKKDENGELLPDSKRITKFGKFIRATSIDELPQLFNILFGQMSFIGPRPKDIKECVFLTEQQCGRFRATPGITGLAQVNGRNSIPFNRVAEFDNQYANKITLWKDVKIFFKTFAVVFRRKDIDSVKQDASNFSFYYGEYLLEQGLLTQEEYNHRVAFARTLRVGDVMPSIDQQREREELEKLREQSKADELLSEIHETRVIEDEQEGEVIEATETSEVS